MYHDEKDNLEFELSQYLDGQLRGRRARRLERRLEQEPALREELKKYAALDEQLSAFVHKGVPGLDYDWQRSEISRMLERKRLLEARPRRTIFLRPVFWGTGGALAVAASIVVGIMVWMSSPGGPTKARATLMPEVSVALVMPAVPAQGYAQAKLRRLDENDYRLAGDAAEELGTELAASVRPPSGTVMVSVNRPKPSKWGNGGFLFPAEF